jgi:hypothetical protein
MKMSLAWYATRIREITTEFDILTEKSEWKRPFGRQKYRGEYNNKIYVKEIGFEGLY